MLIPTRLRTVLLFLGAAHAARAAAQESAPHIRIGPNILVSHDGDVPHAEVWIAAHPTDPDVLLGASHTVRDAGSHVMLEFYTSHDGGQSWTGTVHPREMAKGGGDPIVGFSAQGTMLGISLGGGMWAYRSEDGGTTWDSRQAGRGDHERLAVDYSTGAFAGRMYLAAEVSDGKYTPDSLHRAVHLWRSSDDGRTWIGPVTLARSPVGGVAVSSMVVLSDGTLAVVLQHYPNPGKDMTTPTWDLETAISTDGGVTFSNYAGRSVYFSGYGDLRRRQGEHYPDTWGPGADAAADTKGTRFRDRIYMAYIETRHPDEGGRLVFTYSADHGRSWSAAKDLFPETHGIAAQFQPAIAVNRDGCVGLLWYDTRETESRDSWHVYFAASADGGASWSSPVRVSTQPSTSFAAPNVRPVPFQSSQNPDGVRVSLFSAFSRWPNGGDYMGLTADANSVFHPLWADARAGNLELYTSRVEVSVGGATLAAALRSPRTLNDKLGFVVDPIRVDWTAGVLLVPVRLKNVSNDTLYGPFTVRLKSIGAPATIGAAPESGRALLLNATNGKATAPGAEMDYSAALRDMTALPPNAVTDAVLWRVKPASMRNTGIGIVADVLGSVRAEPASR